jgi:polyhydroxybutyrate depolymerase
MRASLFAIAIAITAACGSSDGNSADAGDVRPDARPAALGGDRPVSVEAPSQLEPGRTYPLIVVLHGYGANGFVQAAYLGITPLRTDPGAIILAPDGTIDGRGNRFWNGSPACCDDGRNVDDVAYLGGLIDDAIRTWPVDPKRVYLVGHSNGSFMAYRLACERADVISAIVGLAGADISVDGAGCTPSQPVSVLHIHGTDDDTILYAGDPVDGYPSAGVTAMHWAVRNGCAGEPSEGKQLDLEARIEGAETNASSVSDCPATGAVELWTINGGSHLPSFQDDLGARVWAWMDAHRRP